MMPPKHEQQDPVVALEGGEPSAPLQDPESRLPLAPSYEWPRRCALALPGILLGLMLWTADAQAQVGIYVTPPGVTCTNDSRLTAPVGGGTFCFDATVNALMAWDGARWFQVYEPTLKMFGCKGDGVTDDTTCIQTAVNLLKSTGQPSAFVARGGLLKCTPGRYRITASIVFQNIASFIFRGSGFNFLLLSGVGQRHTNDGEGACVIYNDITTAGQPAFKILGITAPGWETRGLVFEDLSIRNLRNTVYGVTIDNTGGVGTIDNVHFHRFTIMGGDRQLYITGTAIFDVFCDKCIFQENDNLAPTFPNYGLYSDSSDSPGISTTIRNSTFRNLALNAIRIASTGSLAVEQSTIESIGQEPIWFSGSGIGVLKMMGTHFETPFQSAFWNGTYYQRTSGDATWASVIRIDNTAFVGGVVNIYGTDANLQPVSSMGNPAKYIPFVLMNNGAATSLNVYGFRPDTGGPTLGQPLFRFDGSASVRYNLLGVELHRAWSGSGALFAGTQTDVRGFYATVGPNGGNAGTGPLPPGTTFEMELANAAARGTALPLALTNTHAPASNNTLGMAFRAKNDARTLGQYGAVLVQTSDPSAGAELGEMLLQVASGGGAFVNSTSMSLKNGVLVGAPTGGYKGAGTINVAGDIYKNNTAYTNPDYVLEQWATGQISRFRDREGAATYDGLRPLASVRDYVRAHYALPWIAEARQRGGGTLGLFDGGEAVLASLEESYLYIFQLEEQLRDLRQRLERLERR